MHGKRSSPKSNAKKPNPLPVEASWQSGLAEPDPHAMAWMGKVRSGDCPGVQFQADILAADS